MHRILSFINENTLILFCFNTSRLKNWNFHGDALKKCCEFLFPFQIAINFKSSKRNLNDLFIFQLFILLCPTMRLFKLRDFRWSLPLCSFGWRLWKVLWSDVMASEIKIILNFLIADHQKACIRYIYHVHFHWFFISRRTQTCDDMWVREMEFILDISLFPLIFNFLCLFYFLCLFFLMNAIIFVRFSKRCFNLFSRSVL